MCRCERGDERRRSDGAGGRHEGHRVHTNGAYKQVSAYTQNPAPFCMSHAPCKLCIHPNTMHHITVRCSPDEDIERTPFPWLHPNTLHHMTVPFWPDEDTQPFLYPPPQKKNPKMSDITTSHFSLLNLTKCDDLWHSQLW